MRHKLTTFGAALILSATASLSFGQDDPAKVADQRLAALKAIQDQRMVLLQRRENLSQQVVPIQNQIKTLNGQGAALLLQCGSLESRLNQLQTATEQLQQQRGMAQITGQTANLDAMIQQNIADGRALEIQLDNASSQLAGVETTKAGLSDQLRDAEIAAQRLYSEADQLRIEWLKLMDPFGKLARAEHETAILTFTEWVVLDGENGGAFLARGFAYRHLGDFKNALQDFQRAVELGGPLGIAALAGRGAMRHAMGKRRDGMADLSKALKLDKADALAYLLRANARLAEGNYRNALADLRVASQLNGKDPDAHQQLALLLAACPQKSIRNGKKAIDNAKIACDLTKNADWVCVDTLAAAYAEVGDFEKAVDLQTRALKLATAEHRDSCSDRLKLYEDKKPLRIEWENVN
jgi:tetratricopeptide (TPR) repeat protein